MANPLFVSQKLLAGKGPGPLADTFRQIQRWASLVPSVLGFGTLNTNASTGPYLGQPLLFQFGDASGTTAANGIITVTFPQAFPNGALMVLVEAAQGLTAYRTAGLHSGGLTKTKADIIWYGANAGAAPAIINAGAVVGTYIAIGF